jgi:hypothetical protein
MQMARPPSPTGANRANGSARIHPLPHRHRNLVELSIASLQSFGMVNDHQATTAWTLTGKSHGASSYSKYLGLRSYSQVNSWVKFIFAGRGIGLPAIAG